MFNLSGEQLTVWFLRLWVLAAVAWELYAFYRFGEEATISTVMLRWASDNPIIAVAVGVLIGHIFWNNSR